MFAINGTVFLLSVLLVLSGALLCLLVQAAFFATHGRTVRRLRAAALPALLGAVEDCALLVDKKGRIVEVNPVFSRAFAGFALRPGETPLRDFCRFLGCEALSDGELTHGGRVYIVCRRDLPYSGAVCLLRDVTARRKTMRNLDALNGRLALLQRQMGATAQAIEADQAARRTTDKATRRAQAASRHFLAGLGRAIHAPAKALHGGGARQTQAAARQLLDIAGDALDMPDLETGAFALSEADFDFGRMLAQVAGTAEAVLQPKHGHIAVEIQDDVPAYLCADEARLARVLAGLLLWAAKAAPPHGNITLAVRALHIGGEACTLAFQVRCGAPAAHTPAAERLAVFRRIARAMGGALSRGASPKGELLLALTVQARVAEAPLEAAQASPQQEDVSNDTNDKNETIEGGNPHADTT